ncbi:HaeIV restriction/modification system, partial [Haemophilus influenzae HK1212]
MLAQNNPQDVLVVKMPADNKEKKAFLGYEWSSAKGSEGIKYLNQTSGDEDDSLAKLKGINQIQTPLFNPQNLFDETKINCLIRQNFNQQAVEIPQTLANYVSLLPLTQMLDFSRVDFDKAIRTNVQKKIKVLSKYPIIALEEFPAEIKKGKSITAKNAI